MTPEFETTLPQSRPRQHATDGWLGLLLLFPDEQPQFVEVGEELTLGRKDSCDVVLPVANVSREHLRLSRDGPVLVAEDLKSRNGTYCDGMRIQKQRLPVGSVLRVGEALALVYFMPTVSQVGFTELGPGVFGGVTMRGCISDMKRVAKSDLSIVLEGESGTGKEGLASAVHHFSGCDGRFVAVNCAALPDHLAESQLFGHKKGAFTGANRDSAGFLAAADGGTLFLDEVLDLSAAVQAKLLRALQQREYVPIGQTTPVPVDLRVVVSSQQSLGKCARDGNFREDLYARLNGYTLRVPALRDRREDIPFLFRHFLNRQFGGRPPRLKASLVECLCLYDWPLNVRELETIAKRTGVLQGHQPALGVEHLPDEVREGAEQATHRVSGTEERPTDETVAALLEALEHTEGNVLKAAAKLGISRSRANRLIAAYSINVAEFRKKDP